MTVHKVGPADVAGYADYLESAGKDARRRGDYYLGREGVAQQAAGQGHGRAAAELGLSGAVRRADMLRVWEGRDPRSGAVLIRRGQDGQHLVAVDCTFPAPKSVSVVWALADPDMRAAIETAQDRAVTVALGQLFDALDVEDREVVAYLPRSDRTAEVVGLMERLVGAEREGFEPPRA